MRHQRKVILTILVLCGVVLSGVLVQYRYHQRRILYQNQIAGYYREYFGREPDAIGLRHWTTRALNREGLEKVRRIGFEEARNKGAA